MNGMTQYQQPSGGMGMGLNSGPLATLPPEQKAQLKGAAWSGFFTGLLVTAAIGAAATVTTATAIWFAGSGKKKKRR